MFSALLFMVAAAAEPPKDLAPPIEKDGWIFPASDKPAEPVWGIKGGIMVGLWPTPGPRGLIRIYTPYLGQEPRQPLNFIAVEPVVGGKRAFSEMENSALDNIQGKRMWMMAELQKSSGPCAPWDLPLPHFPVVHGGQAMIFFIDMEPFANGAHPIVQVILKKHRPHEVMLRTFSAKDGAPIQQCILTATMGNYARLRRLSLKDKTVEAASLWPKGTAAPNGFEPHRQWNADELMREGDEVIVTAAPDEENPAATTYADGTPPWWHYAGKSAAQYWKTKPCDGLVARVNGRRTYWGTDKPIPGSVAFENFELAAPFETAAAFTFGADELLPKSTSSTTSTSFILKKEHRSAP